MKFYGDDLVLKIRERRKQGVSLRGLEKEFGVVNTTISRWVRDIPSNDPNFLRARKKELDYKLGSIDVLQQFNLDEPHARVFAALLYWCEGSKYPSSNQLAFSNSDTTMIKTFLGLLRLGFSLDEKRLRVHLQLHTTHNVKEVTKYWSRLLNIGIENFYKPTLTHPTNSMKRRNYLGTCTIKYYDVKLMLQLTGIFEAFAGKFGEVSEWSNVQLC